MRSIDEETTLITMIILIIAGFVVVGNVVIQRINENNSSGTYHVTVDGNSYISDTYPYINTNDKYVRMYLHGNKVEFPFDKSVTINMSVK